LARVALLPPQGDFGAGPDLLRTRCPGPSTVDVARAGTLAAGVLKTGALGDKRLSLTLAGPGPFAGPGYGGERSGSVDIVLTLTRVRVVTQRVTIYGVHG
jgi:hypothetical protein